MSKAWYTVTMLMKCRIDDVVFDSVTCFEQIHLIRAEDADSAYEKALRLGKSEEQSYKNNGGRNVYWEFVGIINLEEILDERIHDGIEVRSRLLILKEPEELVRDKNSLTVFISEGLGNKTAEEIFSESERNME